MAISLAHIKKEKIESQRVILVEFKNGIPTSYGKKKLDFTCYQNTKKNVCSFPERILVAKSKRICYAASNYETELSKITSSVLKLFVVDKKNSTFKMLDADFFSLKPQLKNPEIAELKDETKSYKEKSSDLTLTFGSKSQQKMINTRMKYSEIAASSVPDDSLTSPETNLMQTPDLPPESSTPSVIPPQNALAKNVDEVYNLSDIISKEELDVLTPVAEIFTSAKSPEIQKWKIENKYTPFIIQYLEHNTMFMNLEKAKLLYCLHYMFCFLRTTFGDWRKKDPVPDVPQPFKQKLMDSFTINKSMPMRLKDKLLAYSVVLALKLCNYVFNCNLFSSSAKIPMTRMTAVAHALGCYINENKSQGTKSIELKLPLFKLRDLPKKRKRP